MPRQARIDAPGALHHVIVRGIQRRKIFKGEIDCLNFLKRLGMAFIAKGIQMGKRPDLTGGGFVRSSGGWSVIKSPRKS